MSLEATFNSSYYVCEALKALNYMAQIRSQRSTVLLGSASEFLVQNYQSTDSYIVQSSDCLRTL